jgi:hypothetical protein
MRVQLGTWRRNLRAAVHKSRLARGSAGTRLEHLVDSHFVTSPRSATLGAPLNTRFRISRTKVDTTQQPDEVRAIVMYSEVYRQTPTPQWVKTLLARTNKWVLINYVCSLSAIMHTNDNVAMDAKWQARLVGDLGDVLGATKTLELMLSRDQRLFHEAQLGLMVRYALAFGSTDDTVGELGESVLRLALAINELYTDVRIRGDASDDEKRKRFLKLELQSAVLPNQRPVHIVQRYYRFFRWLENIDEHTTDWLPLHEDFHRLLDMTPGEYLASMFLVLSHFMAITDVAAMREHPAYFRLSQYTAIPDERRTVTRWIERFACTERELIDDFEPSFSQSDLAPFIDKPLILIDGHTVICPILTFLEDTLNSRFFFTLYDLYKARDGKGAAERFSRLQGKFLESYVQTLVRTMVGTTYDTFGEILYNTPTGSQSNSTDVVAIRSSDGCAAFVEVTKTRFRLAESIFAMDEQAIFKDIDTMILRKGKQIQDRIADMQAGLFSYDQPVTAIAPLVVTGQSVPGLAFLKHYIDEQLLKRDILQQTAAPLVHCDIEELEMLTVLAPGEIDLYELLLEKARHPELLARRQSLNNYLHYHRADLLRRKSWREMSFPEFEMAINEMISPALQGWGIGSGGPIVDSRGLGTE